MGSLASSCGSGGAWMGLPGLSIDFFLFFYFYFIYRGGYQIASKNRLFTVTFDLRRFGYSPWLSLL
jgi:hypothetical protein